MHFPNVFTIALFLFPTTLAQPVESGTATHYSHNLFLGKRAIESGNVDAYINDMTRERFLRSDDVVKPRSIPLLGPLRAFAGGLFGMASSSTPCPEPQEQPDERTEVDQILSVNNSNKNKKKNRKNRKSRQILRKTVNYFKNTNNMKNGSGRR